MKQPVISLPLLCFAGVAIIADFFGIVVGYSQVPLIAPAAGLTVISLLVDFFGNPFGLADLGKGVVAGVFSIQIFLAASILAVFYSVTFMSPGTFTMSDRYIAMFVFIMESVPVVCALPIWGLFTLYLRWHIVTRMVAGSRT